VIGGWFWDDGLGDKLGVAADGVSRGEHADLLSGIRLPLFPQPLPLRPFDESEQAIVADRFAELYDRFVDRVAEARGMYDARVRELGEGRVWTGEDAVANGLCDRTGTLLDAIAVARADAGIDADAYVVIDEFPSRRVVDWSRLIPSPLGGLRGLGVLDSAWPWTEGVAAELDAALEPELPVTLDVMARNPGAPLVLTPGFAVSE
jgi:protease-4